LEDYKKLKLLKLPKKLLMLQLKLPRQKLMLPRLRLMPHNKQILIQLQLPKLIHLLQLPILL